MSKPALNTTTIPPLRKCSARAAATSSVTTSMGWPWVRAYSVVIPWIAAAVGGIATPGSASQVWCENDVRCRSSPSPESGLMRWTIAALTSRSVCGLTPVVSVSKPAQGRAAHGGSCMFWASVCVVSIMLPFSTRVPTIRTTALSPLAPLRHPIDCTGEL